MNIPCTTTYRLTPQQRKRIFATVTVLLVCAQFQLINMARKDENKQPKAQWNEAEVDALLDYLITQKSKIAGTTFKDEVFNEALNIIAGMGTYGSSKTGVETRS